MTQQNYLVRICPRCTGIINPNPKEERIFCPHNCGFSGEPDAYRLVVDDEKVNQELERLTKLLHENTHLSAYRETCKNRK